MRVSKVLRESAITRKQEILGGCRVAAHSAFKVYVNEISRMRCR